jgi:hypothetical protein
MAKSKALQAATEFIGWSILRRFTIFELQSLGKRNQGVEALEEGCAH